MKRLSVTIAALTVLVHLGSPVLEACGAKFLVASSIARYQRLQFAANPANILVYQQTDHEGADDDDLRAFAAKLRDLLEGVGHSVTVVATENDLQAAARTRDFDIVMMYLEVARRLRSDVESWSPDSAVLPIVAFSTRPQASRARQEFGQVLKLPAKNSETLSTVHDTYTGG